MPWKRITVQLDTYSGAPVDFAAYPVDPADVLVAGAATVHAVDTSHLHAVARWRFTPPPGLRYTPNQVDVPLQNREGFFVIEARRGDAVQQTWLNLTRIGLVTKESPGGIVLYAADLGTGRALRGMRVTYLVGTHFIAAKTDAHGISRPSEGARPRFALAEWGASKAFVSFLPQAPVPATLVGVRADRPAVRAGESVRVIGFARRRAGSEYKPASGEARVAIVARGRTLASANVALDAAGAFSAGLTLPTDAPAGDAAVLATVAGASGGAAIHVDGLGDVVLALSAGCSDECAAAAPLPLTVEAKTPAGAPVGGRTVRVQIVRSPHVLPPGAAGDASAWATTQILDTRVVTDATGVAKVTIPAPSDALPSTYAVFASSGAATASARLVAPAGRTALAVAPESARINIGDSATVALRGFDAIDGHPAAGLSVRVRIVHGPDEQQQQAVLDADGRARVEFRNVVPGTNLIYAEAESGGRTITDVNQIVVAPQAVLGETAHRSASIRLVTDKARYRVGERVTVEASLAGATGDAFVTLEGVRPMGEQTVAASGGHVTAQFTVPETVGDAQAGVAFVRDGAIEYAATRIAVDGPGHARLTTLTADQASYAPGATARVTIADGQERAPATIAVRIADQPPSGGAAFGDAPNVLAGSGTTTQDPASLDPAWHGSVSPSRSTAVEVAANERQAPAAQSLGTASPRALLWRIDRADKETIEVPLPRAPGRYVVSVLKISDDGNVGAATLAVEVR